MVNPRVFYTKLMCNCITLALQITINYLPSSSYTLYKMKRYVGFPFDAVFFLNCILIIIHRRSRNATTQYEREAGNMNFIIFRKDSQTFTASCR